jgi:hypothetical protein
MAEKIADLKAINIDEISEIGQNVPIGRYIMRVTDVVPHVSGKDNDVVFATGPVLRGIDGKPSEQEGLDLRLAFNLGVYLSPKNNKKYAGGISDMKAAFAAVGKPLPRGFNLDLNPNSVARLVAERLGKLNLDVLVYEELGKDGKTYNRSRVLGIEGQTGAVTMRTGGTADIAAAAAAAAPTNGVATTAPAAAAPATAVPESDPLKGLL